MKFKIDENLPIELTILWGNSGHDVMSVSHQNLTGAPDSDIAAVCQKENRVLVTLDLDFSDIRAYPPEEYPGIIVFRLHRQDKLHILKVAERMIPLITDEQLIKYLWIVDENKIRIRG